MKTAIWFSMAASMTLISACGGDSTDKDGSTDTGTETGTDTGTETGTDTGEAPPPGPIPSSGDWAFEGAEWLSDECQAMFLSTPIGWTVSNPVAEGFSMAIRFEEQGSMAAEAACTLDDGIFLCETVIQEFTVNGSNVFLAATSEGNFSDQDNGTLQVTFDIECSGAACESLVATSPCTSVQAFDLVSGG